MSRNLIIALLLLLPAQTRATTITPFTFDQLCEKANAIYQARCVGCRSARGGDGTIFTTATLRVLDPVRGEAKEVSLRLPGGTLNGTTLTIPGFPVFRDDDEVVIFLTRRDGAGYPWPVGMGQGVYPVLRDAAGRAKVAVQPGLNPSPLAKPALGDPAPESIPLEEFVRLIRARLRQNATDSRF
jgi:hypothetical protein